MKKFLLLSFFLTVISANAQYRKLPLTSGYYWQEKYGHVGNMPTDFWVCTRLLQVQGDSVINGKTFKKIFSYNSQCSNSFGGNFLVALIRDDTVQRIVTRFVNQQEKILFNFNKNVGDTAMMWIEVDNSTATMTVTSKDSVMLGDGLYHKRLRFWSNFPSMDLIEGIGSTGGLLQGWDIYFEGYSNLLCVGRFTPSLSLFSSEGQGASCPNLTGLTDIKANEKNLTVSPSPADDYILIRFGGDVPDMLNITNTMGLVVQQVAPCSQADVNVNVSSLAPGIYFLDAGKGPHAGAVKIVKN